MKKTLLALSMAATLSLNVSTALAKPASSKDDGTGAITARILEQVLNSIEMAAVDVNIKSLTITGKKDEKTGEKTNEVKMDDVRVDGMLVFGADWTADLIKRKENTPHNANLEKVYPKMVMGADNLALGVNIRKTPKNALITAQFFNMFNPKVGKWEPRPLVVQISNHMNKSLFKVRIHSLKAEARVNPKNPKIQEIVGTCKADKILLDIPTGTNKQVQWDCSFSGPWTDKGYEIKLSWDDNK